MRTEFSDILPNLCLDEQPIEILLAQLIWGEARGEPVDGKIAVAWVAVNRSRKPGWWGTDLRQVILKPYQFSCWNKYDPNRRKLKEPLKHDSKEAWFECYRIALGVLWEVYPDPTNGCTHYVSGGIRPNWLESQTPQIIIGSHEFFQLDIVHD